jgi:hypothetical protein
LYGVFIVIYEALINSMFVPFVKLRKVRGLLCYYAAPHARLGRPTLPPRLLAPQSLTSMIGSCRLLCYRTLAAVEWWLSPVRDRKYIIVLYYHLENINGGKEKWWPGRDMVWVLVGVRGVTVDAGMAWLHCFPCLCQLRTDRCISHRGKSHIYCLEHILGYGRFERLVALLSWIRLFSNRLSGFCFGGGGPCTALSPGLRGPLGVPVWTGT